MGGAIVSVINQMLNQLEQRGVHAPLEQAQIRAVAPIRRIRYGLLWLGFLAALGLAGVSLLLAKHHDNSPPLVTPLVLPTVAMPEVKIVEPSRSVSEPALRLSFELGSIPLPVTSQQNIELPAPVADKVTVSAPAEKQLLVVQAVRESAVAEIHKPAAAQGKEIDAPMKKISPEQLADAEFAKATLLAQQHRVAEAVASYQAVLKQNPAHHAARQGLVALLLEEKRGADAERVLQEGLSLKPENLDFAMLLARLQVEHGAVEQATLTLQKSLPYADSHADLQAFLAALLQRQNRHKEAINHYQIALQLAPTNGVWLMGFGISLQAVQRNADAQNAYQRALASNSLSPELRAFVQQKLKALNG